MYSLSQIASAYHFSSVRRFKKHVRDSGLDKVLPKLLAYSATVYQNELSIIQQHLGPSSKISKLIQSVEA